MQDNKIPPDDDFLDSLDAINELEEQPTKDEPSLPDEPMFAWLLRQTVAKQHPDDVVLNDLMTHVIPPLSIYLANKSAKGGDFVQKRRAEGMSEEKLARFRVDQSLRAHLVNGLLPTIHISKTLHQWQAPRFRRWNERVYRLLCAGFILHDWVKLPDIEAWLEERGVTHDSVNPATHLSLFEEIFPQWCEKLGLTTFLAPIGGLEQWLYEIIYIVANTQRKWGTMLNLAALPHLPLKGRERALATDLSTLADLIAYTEARTPVKIASPTSPVSTQLGKISDNMVQLVYHHVPENRGVLTNFVHNAALDAMRADGCVPLLYAPSGVVYLTRQREITFPQPEAMATATIHRIRQLCGNRLLTSKKGFSRAGKGLKTADYFDMLLTLPQQIQLTTQAVFAVVHPKTKRATKERLDKIKEKSLVSKEVNLNLPDDLRSDQLAEFCAFCSKITKQIIENVNERLLEHLGIPEIKDDFIAMSKARGGAPYHWYYAAGYYLKHVGVGLDDGQWREKIEEIGHFLGEIVIEALGENPQNERAIPSPWQEIHQYISQTLTFGHQPQTKTIQDIVTAELTRYQSAKLSGRKASKVCSLCTSKFTITEQDATGLLFQPQVYTNKQALHGSKAIRHICQICKTEMMLRQILMNRGGSVGKNFEKRRFRYLYLYPTYFFTPETLSQLHFLYDRLKRVSFTALRKGLLAEGEDGVMLQLDAGTFQHLQEFLITPDPPEDDTLFRLRFPESDPPTSFFIGVPPPGRDAKDAAAWVNPAWLALILPLLIDVKVVATESPLPILHEADDIDEVIYLDAPHDFVSALVGRERINIDQQLLRLQKLTTAYMVHMDGNANFSKGDYRWHVIPLLAKRLASNGLWAGHYLKKWQRSQGLDTIPNNRAHLYRQFIQQFDSPKGELNMSHAEKLTSLYRQFYRHKRLNANSILRPITVASKAILNADPRLFDDKKSLREAVHGELYSFMNRVASGSADGRLAPGSDFDSRDQAIHDFSAYFVEEIYYKALGADTSALRGKQLNLLKSACEVIYRDEDAKYWREKKAQSENK